MKVDEILRVKGDAVHRVTTGQRIKDAVSILSEKNIGAVVVVDTRDRLVGILSERDVVRRLEQRGESVMDMEIHECMTPEPFTCDREATVNDILEQMTNRRVRHMPVVENGVIAGLISIGDVVKRKIEETEQEAAALREYIAT